MIAKENTEQKSLLIHLCQLMADGLADEKALANTCVIPNMDDGGFTIRSQSDLQPGTIWDIVFPDCPDSPAPVSFIRYQKLTNCRVAAAACEIGRNADDELISTISETLAQALFERNRNYANTMPTM